MCDPSHLQIWLYYPKKYFSRLWTKLDFFQVWFSAGAAAALPSTTFIAQNWTALPTKLCTALSSHNSTAHFAEKSHHSYSTSASASCWAMQWEEDKCRLYNWQAPEPWRPGGNGHRGSQVCPLAFPPLSQPVQKGQMSLNCFNPAAMGQLFQTAASLQLLALVL